MTVPRITGLTLSAADKVLRSSQLTIGQISPQPPDTKGKIESQIPAANENVKAGTPVGVFFAQPAPPASVKGEKQKKAAKRAAAGGPVPAVKPGTTAAVLAQQVAKQGIVPKTVNAYNAAKRGTVFATRPPAGTKLKAGDMLTLLVSAGRPEVAYDDGDDVVLVDAISGKKRETVASGPQLEKDPAFAPTGKRVVYTSGGQLYLLDLGRADAAPRQLTRDTREYTDPAWAPTSERDVLAFAAKRTALESQLCVGEITRRRMVSGCKVQPGLLITRAIHWSTDGRTILAFARDALGQQGMMRWRSRRPLSPDPRDWGEGKFVTTVSTPGQGVIDAAVSPDGRTLAVAANFGGNGFHLYLAKPGDFPLARATPTRVRACKLAWRPDSKELAVVEADTGCRQEVGELMRVPLRAPNHTSVISSQADNPSFEPLAATP